MFPDGVNSTPLFWCGPETISGTFYIANINKIFSLNGDPSLYLSLPSPNLTELCLFELYRAAVADDYTVSHSDQEQ